MTCYQKTILLEKENALLLHSTATQSHKKSEQCAHVTISKVQSLNLVAADW